MINNDIIIDIEDTQDIEITIESKQYTNLQSKIVSPTTEEQVITNDESYDALKDVTIRAVDNSIDENITSGNIKSGVTILGVEGDYAPDYEGGYEITQNDTYQTANKRMAQNLIVNVADNLSKLLTNTMSSYKVPNGVTTIPQYLFYGVTSLTNLDLNGVTKLSDSCLERSGVNLNNLNFTNLITIGNRALYNIPDAQQISGELNLPNVTSIGQYAIQPTKITKLTIGNINTPVAIGQYAFQSIGASTNGAEVYVPNIAHSGSGQNIFVTGRIKKATIGGYLPAYIFQYVSGMTTLILENNFTNNYFCSTSAFYGWQSYTQYGLRNVYFKGDLNDWMSIKAFNDHAGMCTNEMYFKDDNGDTIVDGVTYSKVTSISIPTTITALKQYQFQSFKSLVSVSIQNNITSLPAYLFADCSNLNGLYLFSNQVISLASISAIPSVNNNLIVYVPQSLVSSYQSATNWSTLYNNGTISFMGMAE